MIECPGGEGRVAGGVTEGAQHSSEETVCVCVCGYELSTLVILWENAAASPGEYIVWNGCSGGDGRVAGGIIAVGDADAR